MEENENELSKDDENMGEQDNLSKEKSMEEFKVPECQL